MIKLKAQAILVKAKDLFQTLTRNLKIKMLMKIWIMAVKTMKWTAMASKV